MPACAAEVVCHRSAAAGLSGQAGPASVLAGHAGPDGGRVVEVRVRVRPPFRRPDQAGLHEFQPVEEPGDLRPGAEPQLYRHQLVQPGGEPAHARAVDVVGRVRDGQVAAGRHRVHQLLNDAGRVVLIGDAVQDPDQYHRHRLGEVKRAGRGMDDLADVPQVLVEVGGGTGPFAGEQGAGVGEDDGVVVHVDDPAFGRYVL